MVFIGVIEQHSIVESSASGAAGSASEPISTLDTQTSHCHWRAHERQNRDQFQLFSSSSRYLLAKSGRKKTRSTSAINRQHENNRPRNLLSLRALQPHHPLPGPRASPRRSPRPHPRDRNLQHGRKILPRNLGLLRRPFPLRLRPRGRWDRTTCRE